LHSVMVSSHELADYSLERGCGLLDGFLEFSLNQRKAAFNTVDCG
jgi:hypothetical protein